MFHVVQAPAVLAAVVLAGCALSGLGRLCAGRDRLPAADLAAGWGAYGLALLVGQRLGLSLSEAALPLLLLGLLVFVADRWRTPPARAAMLAWAAMLPLLLVGAAMPLVAWDDFSHWVPNARFLIELDAFPHPSLPPPPSVHGTYPPGIALATQAAGLLGAPFGLDRAPEQAAQVFALLLFGALAAAVAVELRARSVAVAIVAALPVAWLLWLNPGFVPRVVFTNYGDQPTAALLGTALLLLLRATRPGAGAGPSVQAALVLAAVVNVKQSGFTLAAICVVAAAGLLLADRRPRLPRRLGMLALAALPAVTAWWLWKAHAAGATGGFSIRPLAEWAWHLAPSTLASMARVAVSKVAFVALLVLAVAAALPALRRPPETLLARAAVPVSLAACGWVAALFLSYMGTSFSELEIRAAASFWRYMQQLGGALGLLPLLALAEARGVRDRVAQWATVLPVSLRRPGLVLLVVAALPGIGFAHIWPRPREEAPGWRQIAAEIAPVLPPGRPVAVIDPAGVGLAHTVLAFAWQGHVRTQQLPAENRRAALDAAALRQALEASGARHAVLASVDDGVREALGTPPMAPRHWRLLEREGEGWRMLREGRVPPP